jgi:hypothetical protein
MIQRALPSKKGAKKHWCSVITFKENCLIYGTRSCWYDELKGLALGGYVYDPWADAARSKSELRDWANQSLAEYECNHLAAAHGRFRNIRFIGQRKKNKIIFDTKNVMDKNLVVVVYKPYWKTTWNLWKKLTIDFGCTLGGNKKRQMVYSVDRLCYLQLLLHFIQ